MLRRGGGRLARQTGAKPPGLPGAASQAYPNPGSTPVSNGGDYETWQMFLRQGQRAEPPAAVRSGVHRLRGGRAAGPGGHGQPRARTLGGTLNQSQGGIYICGAMRIGSGATGEAPPPVPGGWSGAADDFLHMRISPWYWVSDPGPRSYALGSVDKWPVLGACCGLGAGLGWGY